MPNHLIPVSTAAAMTSSFRSEKENMLDTNFQNAGTLPICETFSKSAINFILNDENCTSMRIYLALDEGSRVKLIITGVNSSDEDIFIPADHPSNTYDTECVLEFGTRCPNSCPPESSLNS